MDTLAGGVNDTILASPAGLSAHPLGLAWFDIHGKEAVLADTAGGVFWRFGREGAGPGELRFPRGLAVSSDGAVRILDPDNARLTVVDADGRLQREVPLSSLEGRPDQIAALTDGLCGPGAHRTPAPRWSRAPAGPPGRHRIPWRPMGRRTRVRRGPCPPASTPPCSGCCTGQPADSGA